VSLIRTQVSPAVAHESQIARHSISNSPKPSRVPWNFAGLCDFAVAHETVLYRGLANNFVSVFQIKPWLSDIFSCRLFVMMPFEYTQNLTEAGQARFKVLYDFLSEFVWFGQVVEVSEAFI
jgi:hypothetical protein